MRKFLALAAAIVAPAAAQTTCTTIGNTTRCDTPPRSTGPYDYGAQMQRGQALAPDYQEQQLKRAQLENLRMQNKLLQQQCEANALRLLKSGDHDGAKAALDGC